VKNATFDEFVKNEQVPPEPEVDWNMVRNEWLQRLDQLYVRIRDYLNDYIQSGQIQIESNSIQLNEENIGPYTAKQITLKIGRKRVKLQPVGTLLIGSRGRIDVVGPRGTTVPLLLVNSKAKRAADLIRIQVSIGGKLPEPPKKEQEEIIWEWKMITRPPERRFIELTQEAFFEMIMEVANG
jgi:hypothetical protein